MRALSQQGHGVVRQLLLVVFVFFNRHYHPRVNTRSYNLCPLLPIDLVSTKENSLAKDASAQLE